MIHITEVGPRDGLQNENQILSIEQRCAFIEKLIVAGAKQIEVASFVNPKLVPQMDGAEALVEQLPKSEEVIYKGLVLSPSGFSRFLQTSLTHVQFSFAISNTFNERNIRRTTEQALEETMKMIEQAKVNRIHTNVILGTVYGCPFEGAIDLVASTKIATKLIQAGADEITYADTIGIANPVSITKSIQLFQAANDDFPLALHLHNTRGRALANALVAIQHGIRRFDTSIAGIGGCPFSPNAVGNICTEDFVSMIKEMGFESMIHLSEYVQVARWIEKKLDRRLEGMVMKLV